ncbi:hypothetical protein ACFQHV_07220 [Promicromonospora thailandica]|uniref:Uncharacterized protein n=1 Tax=Promicromonospora thailandica TaxID=765201 RepID=A0A9X2G507_9MICO|nr:hypothetical protein [Promicromonospora thailandica]MCP2267250.1 hypothetical protein [Promicromonospora thailandica]
MTGREDRGGRVRALRGVLAALSATFVALASHLAAGGPMPGVLGVVVPLALSLPLCVAWAGRRLSLFGLSASVAASQLFFHVLFLLGTPVRGAVPVPSGPHAHHEMPVPAAPMPAGMAHADTTMWLWHGLAAAVTVVVLYRGELLLVRLRELAVRTAAWLLRGRAVVDRPAPFVRPALPGVVAATFRPRPPGPQLSPLLRRGPPARHAI